MRDSRNLIISTTICSALVFFLAYIYYPDILDASLPKIDHAFFSATDDGTEFQSMIVFCLVVSLIPIVIVGCWKLFSIDPGIARSVSTLIMLACTGGAFLFRYFTIRQELSMQAKGSNYSVSYQFEDVNYEYYILTGLLAGFILCYIFFSKKRI